MLTSMSEKTKVHPEHLHDDIPGVPAVWGLVKDIGQYIIASLSSFEMNLELEVIY